MSRTAEDRAARFAWMREKQKQRPKPKRKPKGGLKPCGERYTYVALGCRCEACTAANRQYGAKHRKAYGRRMAWPAEYFGI